MKVIGLTDYGGPEVLHIVDLPEPYAAAGQVRVRVRAADVSGTAICSLRSSREWTSRGPSTRPAVTFTDFPPAAT